MAFHLIDMNTWERRDHYDYYRTIVRSSYTLNTNIKITGLLNAVKSRGLRFYPVFLYVISTAVNRQKEMRIISHRFPASHGFPTHPRAMTRR